MSIGGRLKLKPFKESAAVRSTALDAVVVIPSYIRTLQHGLEFERQTTFTVPDFFSVGVPAGVAECEVESEEGWAGCG
jgi:hypothetical protein